MSFDHDNRRSNKCHFHLSDVELVPQVLAKPRKSGCPFRRTQIAGALAADHRRRDVDLRRANDQDVVSCDGINEIPDPSRAVLVNVSLDERTGLEEIDGQLSSLLDNGLRDLLA